MEPSNHDFRKKVSELKRTRKISECFYHDKSKCQGNIKQSHSLQRNGRLSIIEGNINGQNVIYSFTDFESDADHFIKKFKPIGKGQASTFFGFCDYHDTVLFSPIEGNNSFDDSDLHCFLHSYRSFAHSYHRKKEDLKLYSDENYVKEFTSQHVKDSIQGITLSLRDLEKYKCQLDEMIENQNYSGLEYFTYILPDLFPIASSTLISPYYTYKGDVFNLSDKTSDFYSPLMLTVLPDIEKTIIIFGWFPDDNNSAKFIDELDELNDFYLQKAISSILINYAENTFFSPVLFNAMGRKGQKLLISELETSIISIPSSFPMCKTNFFAPAFSARRLNINYP